MCLEPTKKKSEGENTLKCLWKFTEQEISKKTSLVQEKHPQAAQSTVMFLAE